MQKSIEASRLKRKDQARMTDEQKRDACLGAPPQKQITYDGLATVSLTLNMVRCDPAFGIAVLNLEPVRCAR